MTRYTNLHPVKNLFKLITSGSIDYLFYTTSTGEVIGYCCSLIENIPLWRSGRTVFPRRKSKFTKISIVFCEIFIVLKIRKYGTLTLFFNSPFLIFFLDNSVLKNSYLNLKIYLSLYFFYKTLGFLVIRFFQCAKSVPIDHWWFMIGS